MYGLQKHGGNCMSCKTYGTDSIGCLSKILKICFHFMHYVQNSESQNPIAACEKCSCLSVSGQQKGKYNDMALSGYGSFLCICNISDALF